MAGVIHKKHKLNMKKWCLNDFRMIAKRKNGICLSNEYVNMRTHLEFKCNICNFVWQATPTSIVSGRWCRKCAAKGRAIKQKLTIHQMRSLAQKNEGRCLSKEYINANSHFLWKCKIENHKPFKMTPSAVKNGGQWCPECANERRGNYQLLDIALMNQIAKERGGKCLSKKYLGVHTKLVWKCILGHTFEAVPADIKNQGSWCSICKESWGEKLVREYFEKIFKNEFPKCRPEWLLNNAGNKLELDGYCQELKIAFEHQGEHHYQKCVFSKEGKHFRKILLHDVIKREDCKKRGICLFEIPQIGSRTKIEDLEALILNISKRHGINHKIINRDINPDWEKVYSPNALTHLKNLRNFAKEKHGVLLDSEWKGIRTPLKFKCRNNHEFLKPPSDILYQKSWCPICAGNLKGSIKEMIELAHIRGGECLSKVYVNGKTKLKWHCNVHDYTWWNTPNNIKRGQWCIFCAGKTKWTIDSIKMIAESRCGVCLSTEYKNTKSKLNFKCNSCGNKWTTTMNSILNGSFCPKCGLNKVLRKTRKTLSDLTEIAKSRSGECLSEKYVNSHTPLIFKCKNPEHPPWKAAPTNIRRGKWCRLCANDKLKKK